MTTTNLDVKALAERLAERFPSIFTPYGSGKAPNALVYNVIEFIFASQREDVEADLEIMKDMYCKISNVVSRKGTEKEGLDVQVARLIAQREDVIDREAIARIIEWIDDLDKYGSLDKAFYLDLKRRLNAIARSLPSREAIIEECAKVCEAYSNELAKEADKKREDAFTAVNFQIAFGATRSAVHIRSLAAQPRTTPCSNSVEDGAGRNSIQIESSSDTETANAKSSIE